MTARPVFNPLLKRTGFEVAGSFAGNPKKATVTFTNALPDLNYSITATVDSVARNIIPVYENKAVGGFDINLGTNNMAGISQVSWQAIANGEE
jgi:hypothetical protein